MTIASGTPVQLVDGREGIVIPSPVQSRDRVLVKVKGGKKSWYRVADCTLALEAHESVVNLRAPIALVSRT